MYQSVKKIKSLPDEVKIFCGHEYTESNLKFCLAYDQNNGDLTKRAVKIKSLRSKGLPTVPTTILDEKQTNIFLDVMIKQFLKNLVLKDTRKRKCSKN